MANEVHSVVGAGIVRTYYLGKVTSDEYDKTWYGFDVFVATVAECDVSIMCACAPSIKSISGRFFQNMSSIKNSATGNSDNSEGGFNKGKNIKPVYLVTILTLLLQKSVQGLTRATAPQPPYLEREQSEILSVPLLETSFVICQYTGRNVEPI
jgi:hypothetical protein